jgi:hypothetical protein
MFIYSKIIRIINYTFKMISITLKRLLKKEWSLKICYLLCIYPLDFLEIIHFSTLDLSTDPGLM